MSKKPPFRADHVGSFLRPEPLRKAREKFQNGDISRDDLKAVEDEEIRNVVAMQERVGLHGITDGEFRRTMFHVDFLVELDGVETSQSEYEISFRSRGKEIKMVPPTLQITGKLGHSKGIMTEDFKFLKSVTGRTPKIAMPAPSMLHFRGGREAISKEAYPDLDMFFDDLTAAYQAEIKALADLGCRYIQMDDTNLAYLCDPEHRQRAEAKGQDPDALTHLYAKMITDAFKGSPADMSSNVHLCRGNFQSAWAAEGGYDPVAEIMFSETDIDGFFLEFDDPRSGSFEPLKYVPKGKTVVLGLITTKVADLESPDDIKRRIEEATKYIDIDQLALSPQCGFSSTEHGNELTEAEQEAKLELVLKIAEDVWGTTT